MPQNKTATSGINDCKRGNSSVKLRKKPHILNCLLYKILQIGKRTEPKDMACFLHLYFGLGLLGNTSKAISFCLDIITISHPTSVDLIQNYNLQKDNFIVKPRYLNS
jgi:hypothetical protein